MKTKNILATCFVTALAMSMPLQALAAKDAVLSLAAAQSTIPLNGTTTITIRVNTGTNTNVTTVQSYVLFDPSALQVVGNVDISSSSFPMSFRNTVDNTGGKILLSLSNTTKQTGASLNVATFTVRGIKVGTTTISFDPNNVAVLLSDVDNTNVLASTSPTTITITGGSSSSSSSSSSGGGGGGGGTRSHLGCYNHMCIQVAGLGADECRTDADCRGTNSNSSSSSSGGSSSGTGGGDINPGQCQTPINFRGEGSDGSIKLFWTNNDSRVNGFDIHYGTVPGQYPYEEHTANIDSLTLTGLTKGKTYYITMNAVGSECYTSAPTGELALQAGKGSVAIASSHKTAKKTTSLPPKTSQSGAEVWIPFLAAIIILFGYIVRQKLLSFK
jgi:hypothetical protein